VDENNIDSIIYRDTPILNISRCFHVEPSDSLACKISPSTQPCDDRRLRSWTDRGRLRLRIRVFKDGSAAKTKV